MTTTRSTDLAAQVVIILAFLSMFISHFNLMKTILISLLLLSLVSFSLLLATLIKPDSIIKLNSKEKMTISVGMLAGSTFILLTLIFGMFFYYLNYDSGLLYSLLLLIATAAIIQSLIKLNIVPKNNDRQVLVFGLVISFYTTIMVLGAVYNLSILMITLSNPYQFVQGLLFRMPIRFVEFIIQFFSTNTLFEFFFLVFLPILVLIAVFATGINLVWRIEEKNDTDVYNFIPQTHSTSKFPFIMIIVFFAISQATTGLTEFLSSSFWLLLVIQLLVFVFCLGKEKNSDTIRLQLTILLWILVIGFIKEIYFSIPQKLPIQILLKVSFIDETLVQYVIFFILNSIVFIVLYVLLLKISDQEQERMIERANFLGIVLLLLFIQSVLVELLFTSVLVIIFSYSHFQKMIIRNSKNINKAQINKNLLQVVTELLILLIPFLII